MQDQAPPYAYSCFGLSIRSAIALPEIAEDSSPADGGRPAIAITIGPVPSELPGAPPPAHGVQASGDDILLTVKDVARYLIRGGREIVVDASAGGGARSIRLFLLGSAFGVLCYQRGLLLLHANAIVARGEVVAFAGRSGAGKSTLAAHFQSAGYQVLCDDVCVVSFDEGGRPLAWPGLPRLKLWREAASSFGHDCEMLEPAIDGLEKYNVPLAAAARGGLYPLRRLYVLSALAPGATGQITRLRGAAAVEAVLAQSYRGQYLKPMGLLQRHFAHCSGLLRHVEVYSAPREWGYDVFTREAGKLERHLLET